MEKEREEARKRIAEDEERMLDEARRRDLRDFELGEMGLQGGGRGRLAVVGRGKGKRKERKSRLRRGRLRLVGRGGGFLRLGEGDGACCEGGGGEVEEGG